MYDPRAPSSLLAIAEYSKPAVARQLLRYAMWRTEQEALAKDLVADALLRVCDPQDKPWDPGRASFFRHMRMVMGDVVHEETRSGFEANEIVDGEHQAFDRAVQPIPGPELELHRTRRLQWLRAMWAILEERFAAADPLCMRIWELVKENRHDEPAEYAEALGVPVEAIYEALRRLRYHGQIVREQWDKREAARMAELRAEAERVKKRDKP